MYLAVCYVIPCYGVAAATKSAKRLFRGIYLFEFSSISLSFWTTLKALGDFGVIEPLLTELAHEDSGRRQFAARVLEKVKDGRAVEPLIQALSNEGKSSDGEYVVPWVAAVSLGKVGDKRAVEPLINALSHEDEFVRRCSARALGKLEDVRSVKALMAAVLKDESYLVSFAAATALGQIKSPNTTELLIEGLKNPEPRIGGTWDGRPRLTDVVKNMRAAVEIEPLLNTLDEPNAFIRGNIALALGGLKDERVLDALLKMLSDKSAYVRGRAAIALVKLSANVGDANITDMLINVLSDTSTVGALRDDGAIFIVRSLGQLGDKRAVELLITALSAQYGWLRNDIASSLAKLGDRRAVEPLIQLLHTRDSNVARALGRLGDERIVAPLIEILQGICNSTESHYTLSIAIALMNVGCCEPLVCSVVMSWLLDNTLECIINLKEVNNKESIESFVHFLCVEENLNQLIEVILGRDDNLLPRFLREIEIMAGESAEHLIKSLQESLNIALTKTSPPSMNRVDISYLLAKIGDAKGMAVLIQELHSVWGFTAYTAAEALAGLGDLRAVEPLISVLTTRFKCKHFRDEGYDNSLPHVAGILGELGDLRAFQPLIDALSDEEYEGLRCKAAYGLGELGDDRAIPYLQKALKDESKSVRNAAREAIERLKSR